MKLGLYVRNMGPQSTRESLLECARAAEDAGADVRAGATSTMPIDAPRMSRIVNNHEIDAHELVLETTSDGVALYAFTFASCLVPEST